MEDITIKYLSPHGKQEERKFSKNHSRIDLTMRAAKRIDLSEVSNCVGLQRLDLSHNMIERIDLLPLENCSSLRELWLGDNHITDIDFWPLVNCSDLIEIDISENRIPGFDITPVFLHSNIRMDSSTVISADYLLRYVFTRDELRDRFQLLRIDKAPWAAPPVIMWTTYGELARKFDWIKIKERLDALLGMLSIDKWFNTQRGLLFGLGMDELAGFDGDPRKLLRDTDRCTQYKDARRIIFDNAIRLLELQLETDGPTLFLDTEKMRRTRASKLIPRIAERRKIEVESAPIFVKGSKVFLEKLWMTHYGFHILKALDLGLMTDYEGLHSIEAKFDELDMPLSVILTKDTGRSLSGSSSQSMHSYMLNLINDSYD